MSYWFPARERARAVAWFMMASPLSGVVNGPISGALLEYTNTAWGLAGWQWLFLLEGIPAVILGFVTWWFLTDRPRGCPTGWSPDERDWLSARMAREEKGREARHGLNRLRALRNPRFVLLILLYFTIAMGTNGYGFFAPTIIDARFPDRGADQIGLLVRHPEPRRGDRHDPLQPAFRPDRRASLASGGRLVPGRDRLGAERDRPVPVARPRWR